MIKYNGYNASLVVLLSGITVYVAHA